MVSQKRKLVPVARLKYAPYNPPDRVEPSSLRELMGTMENLGLLYPITVSPKEVIIDGHRRTAAARLLGWKDIEANVVEGDAEAIYAAINTTSKKMGGRDALGVWLSNPRAVTDRSRKNFEDMTKDIGRQTVQLLYDRGFSKTAYDAARRIGRYCEDTSPETLRVILLWLLKFPVLGQVKKVMEAGGSPRVILEAARKGRVVKLSLEVG